MPTENTSPFPAPAGHAPELNIGTYLPARPQARAKVESKPPAAVVTAIAAAIGRLEETVGAEMAALESHGPIDFADINRRKSQSLLELTRLVRSLPIGGDAALAPRLRSLNDTLTANQRLLSLHLAASRELSDMMVGVLHEADSDGTYGQTTPRRSMRA